MRLVFERLWMDTDGQFGLQVSLEGDGFGATHEANAFADDLQTFGKNLQRFPQTISDEVAWKYESIDDKSRDWLILRAYVYDGVGHTALEMAMNKSGTRHVRATSQFSLPVEAAALNSLGKRIEDWAVDNQEPLVFETGPLR